MRDQLLPLAAILAQWQCPVASSEALDLLYWAIWAVLYWRTATAIKNGQQSGCMVLLLFCLLLPWWRLGQYGASSFLMAASRGFWSSPAHAASGNVLCIAPVHPQDLQNGPQLRYM
jgi:hypothetical protein